MCKMLTLLKACKGPFKLLDIYPTKVSSVGLKRLRGAFTGVGERSGGMFLERSEKEMFVEVEGEAGVPVAINIDAIQYIRKCDEEGYEDQCMIQFAGGFPLFVRGTPEELAMRFNTLKEVVKCR